MSNIILVVFKNGPESRSPTFVTGMAQGTMAYFYGIMAKLFSESVSVRPPVATVGIRGTRLLVNVDQKESSHP